MKNCNNNMIGRGELSVFVSGLHREGSIPPNCLVTFRLEFRFSTSQVLCKHSNGERASLANLKLTIGSLLACS